MIVSSNGWYWLIYGESSDKIVTNIDTQMAQSANLIEIIKVKCLQLVKSEIQNPKFW